jgi:hypothetical protein
MPNWVFNNLQIEGSEEQIQKVKEQLNAPFERKHRTYGKDVEQGEFSITKYSSPIISFWNIVRPPDDKVDEYEGIHGYADGEKQGDTPFNWYVFNNREWGTKWDIAKSDEEKYSDTELTSESATHLSYRFQTAWSAPIEAIENLSGQYPELEITLEWEEEQGFGGVYVFQDGSHTIEKEWDIPNSHKDYVDRDNEDGCMCANSEDPDDYYDDCPGAKKVIELTCVKDVEVVKSNK